MYRIIAAVSDVKALNDALCTNINMVFYLAPNINTIGDIINAVHSKGKKIFIHIDMAEGIAKDKFGVEYVKALGADGIISTRANIIKIAKKLGMATVQRFFVIDTHSVDTTIEAAGTASPDMIEIMPGIAAKVVNKIKKGIKIPIIAGGLIETEQEVQTAIANGAVAISTGNKFIWNLNL